MMAFVVKGYNLGQFTTSINSFPLLLKEKCFDQNFFCRLTANGYPHRDPRILFNRKCCVYILQVLEDCHPVVALLIGSCKSLYQLSVKVNAKEHMARPSTPPWSVLDSIAEAKIRAKVIQEDQWCANTTESSS